MRYWLLLSLLVLTMPVLGYDEVISAISYNPSRLGAYTHVKAVREATLAGGLKQQDSGRLNILAKRTITVQCANGATCSAPNTISYVKPVGAISQCTNYSSLCADGATSQKGGKIRKTSQEGTPVYLYGGTLGAANTTDGTIDQINVTNRGNLQKVTASDMTVTNIAVVGTSFGLGNVAITAPSVSSGQYKFVTRVTDDRKRRNVLSIVP